MVSDCTTLPANDVPIGNNKCSLSCLRKKSLVFVEWGKKGIRSITHTQAIYNVIMNILFPIFFICSFPIIS